MITIYKRAHPKTPLMTMIGGRKMAAGMRHGMGWRCDCFGDLGLFHPPGAPQEQWWTHHFDFYPQDVVNCGAQDAWRSAPVAFETCGTPRTWFDKGFDLEFILRQGLKFHGSIFMPKSVTIPAAWISRLESFCNDLGYRFILRQFQASARIKRGSSIAWGAWIENVGVAPIYRSYALAIRATQGNREYIHLADVDIRTWLPGDACPSGDIQLPRDFESGTVMLHVALVDAETFLPKVHFAVDGIGSDGWLPLLAVEIQ